MAENAATELKNSPLLQGKWDEQFSSAPKALGSLATLLVESSTSSSNVRMNIVQSADIGRRTFQQAIQNMDNIQMQFKQQSNLPMQLIQAIYESQGDPDVGRMVLPQLNTIERGFQSVTQLVNQVNQGFDQWAQSVAELQDLSGRENLSETLQQSVKQLQQQSTNLASFFGAYRSLVEATYTQHVRKTTETAGPIFGSGQSPSESQRSELISSLAALRLYLTTLASVAQLWSEVSRDSIFPGLRLVDELGALAGQGAGEGEILKKKSSEVDRWSQQAAGRVEEVAREKQQQTLEIIDQNAQKLKRMLANAN